MITARKSGLSASEVSPRAEMAGALPPRHHGVMPREAAIARLHEIGRRLEAGQVGFGERAVVMPRVEALEIEVPHLFQRVPPRRDGKRFGKT